MQQRVGGLFHPADPLLLIVKVPHKGASHRTPVSMRLCCSAQVYAAMTLSAPATLSDGFT